MVCLLYRSHFVDSPTSTSFQNAKLNLHGASCAIRTPPLPSGSGGTLTVSQRKVRQINDPILPMLAQLHKIVYIAQLPPTLSLQPRRRLVERYKRALFSDAVGPVELKEEMRRLLAGARELIDLDLGGDSAWAFSRQCSSSDLRGSTPSASALSASDFDPDPSDIGITYEQMHGFIEDILLECSYGEPEAGGSGRRQRLSGNYSLGGSGGSRRFGDVSEQ